MKHAFWEDGINGLSHMVTSSVLLFCDPIQHRNNWYIHNTNPNQSEPHELYSYRNRHQQDFFVVENNLISNIYTVRYLLFDTSVLQL